MDLNRRMFLGRTGLCFGSLALDSMLRGGDSGVNGLPHFAPKAKSVIWLFMRGGVSHMESFDPKPMLNSWPENRSTRRSSSMCRIVID